MGSHNVSTVFWERWKFPSLTENVGSQVAAKTSSAAVEKLEKLTKRLVQEERKLRRLQQNIHSFGFQIHGLSDEKNRELARLTVKQSTVFENISKIMEAISVTRAALATG